MLVIGSIAIWVAFAAILASSGAYLRAARTSGPARFVMVGRTAYLVVAAAIVLASVILALLLVHHHFEAKYVYQHTAIGMSKLYWLPSFWAGQEGSFLLWAFWTSLLGVVLSFSSRAAESHVMPVYNCVLLFLVTMLLVRSPFLPLGTHGMPVPTDGLGMNPNLENPWMVIHPPTLFLGFSSLAAPFAYSASSLIWPMRTDWLRRTVPWSLFGFSVLGIAMMMGGYWAYEMLGWGGFWGWDPVENGPLIPWLGLVAFLHVAQVQRRGGNASRSTLFFAMLPFVMALYETFLTRTGVLEKFSVHSFSTLGGVANNILLGVLLLTMAVSLGLLAFRWKSLPKGQLEDLSASRESAYFVAVTLIVVCATISCIGMSAPLITELGVKLHLATKVASVKEDFYNTATFPVALLLAIGMGIGPHLSWKGRGPNGSARLIWAYAGAVVMAVAFLAATRYFGTSLPGNKLLPQLLLFTASSFALIANAMLLKGLLPHGSSSTRSPLVTVGGHLAHIGAVLILLGVVCLVTFVRKDPDDSLVQNVPQKVLGGAYTVTYLGQTGDYRTDKDNALKFAVTSKDDKTPSIAMLPFALRSVEGGQKMMFTHPGILHHLDGDVYFAHKDGPDYYYKTPIYHLNLRMGRTVKLGAYKIRFDHFDRDPQAVEYIQETGQMPPVFPVTAVMYVTYRGVTRRYSPESITRADDPLGPESPEIALPGNHLLAFESMNAGGTDMANPENGASQKAGSFTLRANSGKPAEAFELEITTRPMISLVWIGTLVLFVGGLLTLQRRNVENSVKDRAESNMPVPSGADRVGASSANTGLLPKGNVAFAENRSGHSERKGKTI